MNRYLVPLLVGPALLTPLAFGWIDLLPPFPQSLPVQQESRAAKERPFRSQRLQVDPDRAEKEYLQALRNYDQAVERHGLRSRQAQVAAAELEAAFDAYGQAAGH